LVIDEVLGRSKTREFAEDLYGEEFVRRYDKTDWPNYQIYSALVGRGSSGGASGGDHAGSHQRKTAEGNRGQAVGDIPQTGESRQMMNLTEEQEILIEGLQFLGISADIIKGVVLLLPEKWQIAEMASYLLNNKNANESDILEEAIRISEMEES
jgi:hypothetical protein